MPEPDSKLPPGGGRDGSGDAARADSDPRNVGGQNEEHNAAARGAEIDLSPDEREQGVKSAAPDGGEIQDTPAWPAEESARDQTANSSIGMDGKESIFGNVFLRGEGAVRGLRQRRAYYRCCIPALAGFVSPRSIAPDGSISMDYLREEGNGFLSRQQSGGEFGVVRFGIWVFPCSQFGGAVFSPVHAKQKMLIER